MVYFLDFLTKKSVETYRGLQGATKLEHVNLGEMAQTAIVLLGPVRAEYPGATFNPCRHQHILYRDFC